MDVLCNKNNKSVKETNMKVLWITNIVFPEVLQVLTNKNELKSSGGWMLGASEALISTGQVNLAVATVSQLVEDVVAIHGESILYYVIPYGKGNMHINKQYEKYWVKVNDDFKPEVVHIYGTEFAHGYAYMRACGVENVVISIQGILSACYQYYTCGISRRDIYQNLTLRDLIKGSILKDQKRFRKRSFYEQKMLSEVRHVIGRTSWDRARVQALNPNLNYYSCNEILRNEFYDGSIWDLNRCRKNTIFLSQAGYPIKGVHQLLRAMPLILKKFPNTKIRIAGQDIRCRQLKDYVHYTGYGRFVKRLIKSFNLNECVEFIGNLNAEEMKQEYLNCHVFACPSSIENSPNSLGEAQILGAPCVASYVGGIPDMMKGNEGNLYRYDEVEMLADNICRIFSDDSCGHESVNEALNRHNKEQNTLTLLAIYSQIINTRKF